MTHSNSDWALDAQSVRRRYEILYENRERTAHTIALNERMKLRDPLASIRQLAGWRRKSRLTDQERPTPGVTKSEWHPG